MRCVFLSHSHTSYVSLALSLFGYRHWIWMLCAWFLLNIHVFYGAQYVLLLLVARFTFIFFYLLRVPMASYYAAEICNHNCRIHNKKCEKKEVNAVIYDDQDGNVILQSDLIYLCHITRQQKTHFFASFSCLSLETNPSRHGNNKKHPQTLASSRDKAKEKLLSQSIFRLIWGNFWVNKNRSIFFFLSSFY